MGRGGISQVFDLNTQKASTLFKPIFGRPEFLDSLAWIAPIAHLDREIDIKRICDGLWSADPRLARAVDPNSNYGGLDLKQLAKAPPFVIGDMKAESIGVCGRKDFDHAKLMKALTRLIGIHSPDLFARPYGRSGAFD